MDLQRPGQISEPDDVTQIVRAPRPWERGGTKHVRRTTIKGAIVLTALVVPVTFAGLAWAGVLPDVVQRPVSNAAGKVGLSVPNPDDDIEMALNRDALAKTGGSSATGGKKSSGTGVSGSGGSNGGGGSKGGGSGTPASASNPSMPYGGPSAGAGGASPTDIGATPDSGICSPGAPTGTTLNEYCGGANTGTATGVTIERSSTTSSTKVDTGTPPASTAPPGSLPPSTTAPRPPTTVTAPPSTTVAPTTTAKPRTTTTRRRH